MTLNVLIVHKILFILQFVVVLITLHFIVLGLLIISQQLVVFSYQWRARSQVPFGTCELWVSFPSSHFHGYDDICTWGRNLWPGAKIWTEGFFFNWKVTLAWPLQKCWCHCQGHCLGCPMMENWRTKSRGRNLVSFQVSKLGHVFVCFQEAKGKAVCWFLSLGEGCGPAAFLGVNLTLNISVDFDYYFFWCTRVPSLSPIEKGDSRLPSYSGVDIKRHLRYFILGITVMFYFKKFLSSPPAPSHLHSGSKLSDGSRPWSFLSLPPDTPFAFIQTCVFRQGDCCGRFPSFFPVSPISNWLLCTNMCPKESKKVTLLLRMSNPLMFGSCLSYLSHSLLQPSRLL